MKYRKKPVVIEAFKYDGDFQDKDGKYYIPQWGVDAYKKGVLFFKSLDTLGHPCALFVKTLEGDMKASVGDYIIQGVNGELYPCKPDIFEKTYESSNENKTMNFGEALEAIKQGKKAKRKGWNGKTQYIEIAKQISYVNAKGDTVNCNHDAIGNKAIAFVGTSGVQMGWLASQADMLAEDWEVVAYN